MMRGMHGMHEGYGYGYGSIVMIVFLVVLILLVMGVVVFLLAKFLNGNKSKTSNKYKSNPTYPPLVMLQERLVKGEIDEAEYDRLKEIIERDRD